MNDVAIIQRQTLDWARMTPETYAEASRPFCRLWGRPDDYMQTLVALWDRTFAQGYFTTRAALKALADAHHAQLPRCRFVPFDEYRNIPDDAASYVFVDDDDWLSPELGPALLNSDRRHHDGALWKAVTLGAPRSKHPLFFWGLNGRCMTNNYAVHRGWLEHGGNLASVRQHGDAQVTLAELHLNLLDAWLSITNKSPCSSLSLEAGLGGERTPEALARSVEEQVAAMQSLEQDDFERAPWAWPLFQATRELFITVRDSRRA